MKNDGGPAFSCERAMIDYLLLDDEKKIIGHRAEISGFDGMSLRDYFAAKAMEGAILKHDSIIRRYADTGDFIEDYDTFEELSKVSYMIADAMLKAREE